MIDSTVHKINQVMAAPPSQLADESGSSIRKPGYGPTLLAKVRHVRRLSVPTILCAMVLSSCGGSDTDQSGVADVNGEIPEQSEITEPNQVSDFNDPIDSSENTTDLGGGTSSQTETDFSTRLSFDIFPPSDTDLAEQRGIYQQDGYGEVDVIRVDVRTETTPGICTLADDSGCTLADVTADTNRKDAFSVKIPAHYEATDYPDDGTISNAELSQRGGTTRRAEQKSFKIRLDDRDNLWRGERSLLLNKHPYESTRIRNKLAFDLMSDMPHIMSFRTQFVNLWIDDGQGPDDYGLFTHVEAPGANYLDKRNIDRDDNLYKVALFRFNDDDLQNVQVDTDGEPLDEDRFETSLEIESGDDHSMLVEMLEAMQDPERSFDSVLDEYFNRNNVLMWMAVNVLMHQTDAVTHNFLLYNPKDTRTFYFLPWDYDGGFAEELEPPAEDLSNQGLQQRLYYGYARGINSNFHTRYYQLPGIHEQIVEAASVIRENWMTDAQIAERGLLLESIVEPYVTRLPDIEFNTSYNAFSVAGFPLHVAENFEALQSRFGIPMPPQLDKETQFDEASDEWVFRWTPAYDVTGHSINYDLQVSTSPQFGADDIVYSVEGLDDTPDTVEHRVPASRFRSGDHFVRVIARASSEPQRFWQVVENQDVIVNGQTMFGMVEFEVP